MLKEIKNELYYQTKSYMIFVCMIAVIVCSVYVGYTQLKNVENSYNIVKTVKTQFENENEEFSKKSAENVLNEVIQKYYSSKVALNKENSINQYFSSVMLFGIIIIMSIYTMSVRII